MSHVQAYGIARQSREERSREIEGAYPLSPMQQGILHHYLSDPHSGRAGLEQVICSLREVIDIPAFRKAWDLVLRRHAVLRTSFRWEEPSDPLQCVHREVPLPFEERDWTRLSKSDQQRALEEYLGIDRCKGFDLAEPPNLRIMAAKVGEGDYTFVWSFHQILLDDRSVSQVLDEVFAFYDANRGEEDSRLSPPRPYREHIDWLQKQDLSESESFWRETLGGVAVPTRLHTNSLMPHERGQRCSFATMETALPEELIRSVASFVCNCGITLEALIHGVWAILLNRYSGEEDVVYGSIQDCHPTDVPEAHSSIGVCVNAIPIHTHVNPQATITEWFEDLQKGLLRFKKHSHFPLHKICDSCGFNVDTRIFDSLVVFKPFTQGGAPLTKISRWKPHLTVYPPEPSCPLVLTAYGEANVQLEISYDLLTFDEGTIQRMLGHLETLLEGVVNGSHTQLSDLSLLTEAERHQVLVEWNDTQTDYPRHFCIHELLEAQSANAPNAVALVEAVMEGNAPEKGDLTYGELNRRANQVAHLLLDMGIDKEVFVGVFMERSMDMIVAIVGILKAGCAYLPLDRDYPRARLDFMLRDTDAPVLITQSHLLDKLPAYQGRIIFLDLDAADLSEKESANCQRKVSPENLAYVVYTSGSTGKPKGVCVPHRAVVRLVKDTNYATFSQRETFLQFAPISFDASTFEIWGSLLNGAKLVIFPPGLPTLEEFGAIIRKYEVSTLWLTASLFCEMVDNRLDDLRGVRQLLAGGEALSVSHVRKALGELKTTRLINGYGPTENTTFTCCSNIGMDTIGRSVPIGRPIANTTVYILDRHLNPVPIGVPGELYTGGDGLARCYLNSPDLTAARFVRNPFSRDPEAKMYRVGDLARYLPSGEVEFLGRIDNQVKIRGFRIELGEIESALNLAPGVRQGVVLATGEMPADKRLVAYILPEAGSIPPESELRRLLEEKLPDYMIPSAFMVVDEFPLTPNGKIDRTALPKSAGDDRLPHGPDGIPQTPTEKELAEAWSQVLNVPRIGTFETFSSLGGHSLHAIRIASQIRKRLGIDLQPRAIIEQQTIAALAEYVDLVVTMQGTTTIYSQIATGETEEVEI